MPRALHHVTIVSSEFERLRAFMESVIGLEIVQPVSGSAKVATQMLGWPEENPGFSGVILGSGNAGLVEIIEIPQSLKGLVASDIALLSFASASLEALVDASRTFGIPIEDPIRVQSETIDLDASLCEVSGVPIELIRLNSI